MRPSLLAGAVLWAICLVLGNTPAAAQGVGASGDLTGTVTDPSGKSVPNAKVTATETARGVQRTVVTDDHGEYRITGLAPSSYQVSVDTSGFHSARSNVTLTVGQTLVLDFRLELASASTTVVVNTEPLVVDTQQGSQSDTLTQNYIMDLPIDRRDYLTFVLLAPGVANSTRLAADQDFRVKQTPQSGLSFYGSNGRGNSVTVDGGEANDDAGGVRLTVSQDAVQEFQINRSNYGADFGGASGATINIVSKSGTNQLHGSLFGFFRNDALDAADPFAYNQALAPGEIFDPLEPDSVSHNVKNTLSRYQFGANAGFPIKKDKSFLFVAFEGLRQDTQNAVPLLTNTDELRPTAAQDKIINGLAAQGSTIVPCFPNQPLPAAICAGALQSALTVSQLTGLTAGQTALNTFLVNELESNGGLFNYTTREYFASGRFDHSFNANNQLMVSYRYGYDLEENPDVQSLTGYSAGSSIHNYDNNAMAAWYHQFSPATQNEARFQFDYNSFNVVPNEPGEAGLQIPGFVNNLGTNIFLPSYTITRRYEFADNFTVIRGKHTMRFGGEELLRGNHTESHTFFPGRFVFGSLPGELISSQLATTTINPLQAASFGLPQVYQQGFGNPVYPPYTRNRPFTAFYAEDSWRITPKFTLNYGLRYEIDTQYAPLSTYKKDVAPRISFAWSPFNNDRTVVRGGYGIYYAPIYDQIPAVDESLGVLNANHSSVENSTPAGQVNNLVGICGIAGVVAGTGTSPCNREISIYVVPLTGVPGGSAALNSGAIFQTLFAEGLISCKTPTPGNAACITPASLAPFGLNVSNSGPVSPLQVVFVEQPNFRPPYSQQAGLGIEHEIGNGFTISVSYIYSHTIGLPIALDTNLLPAPMSTVTLATGQKVSYRNWNLSAGTDPLGGTEGLPCAPNPFACFVNPLITQNNQYSSAASALYQGGIVEVRKTLTRDFTLFGNYTYSKALDNTTDYNTDFGPQDPTNLAAERSLSEFDQRHKVVLAGLLNSPWKSAVLSGFQLSPIFTYNSGHPFDLLAGGEVNGDNHTTNERPIGAPRNTGIGPAFTDLDMRLTWQKNLHEKTTLVLTAEGFNIANHTNYASVNNVVGPLFGLTPGFTTFNVHGSAALSPSQPLGYTSDFPKREIQLGLRLNF
jgi:Carboxypeptidase regulatory-like domain/TonB dependent receptor